MEVAKVLYPIMRSLDDNDDGEISFQEFLRGDSFLFE